jgi:hypothetical protein
LASAALIVGLRAQHGGRPGALIAVRHWYKPAAHRWYEPMLRFHYDDAAARTVKLAQLAQFAARYF